MRGTCQVVVGVSYRGFTYLPCCTEPWDAHGEERRLCGRPSVEHHVCGEHGRRTEMCAWHWDAFKNYKDFKFDEALFNEFYPEEP